MKVVASPFISFSASTFTGKEKDYESGFHYYGARYYWSEVLTGWLSVDPMMDKYSSISGYAYCVNNPVILIDPDGNSPIKGITSAIKIAKKTYNIYKKTGKLTPKALKNAGLSEIVDIAGDIVTIFSGEASVLDRIEAVVDLVIGTNLNQEGNKCVINAVTSKATRRDVMRKQDIPTSQQPKKQRKTNSGYEYTYEIPTSYGTTKDKSVQQKTKDSSHPNEPHWEAGDVKVDDKGNTQYNKYGTPRLQNGKSKPNYLD